MLPLIPCEVLQCIAIKTVDDTLGPPNAIRALQLTCRAVYDSLSFEANPAFYAEVFDAQFDTPALRRRYAPERLTVGQRAHELVRRWTLLKEIRTIVR